MSETKTEQIRMVIGKCMSFLSSENREAKRMKALLRHALGQSPGDNPELWGWIVTIVPEECQGMAGHISYEEYAIYVTLALYASGPSNDGSLTLAEAVASVGLSRRRLAAAETADSIDKCQTELSHLNRMLAQKGMGYSYCRLAEDLYRWQLSHTEIARKWEREYARKEKKNEKQKNVP